ncbi:hypothetical protein [Chromatium okenii]|uniref:hypothetical protein n=1 Tax=Chromatium okenii TaxID=61644 RepID=UPI003221E022
MAFSHAGHDCVIGDHNIFANTATLAGMSRLKIAYFYLVKCSASILSHWRVCMVAGVTGVAQMCRRLRCGWTSSRMIGLNVVGLRRNGFTQIQRSQIKAVYRLIMRSGLRLAQR